VTTPFVRIATKSAFFSCPQETILM
jgi:hypothetical protein